ncbi:MAG: LPS export ABC transporter periplasmic protein LptC [Spirochaetales bacterium]|nr:LPS export ABC transporter periplasmic protein LptC [Spirochaetales bacterium]
MAKKIKLKKIIFSPLVCILFSCSLDYGRQTNTDAKVPEFIFLNSKFSRYENNKKTMSLNSSEIEQYRSDGNSFAKDAEFQTWDSEGKLETSGNCDFMEIESKPEIYSLFSNIHILNYPEDMEIQAENLKWQSKTEQLTSGKEDLVSIKKENVQFQGKGFSASGVSKAYNFESAVSGILVTEDEASPSEQTENETK